MRRYRIGMVAACPFPAAFASAGLIRELSLALKDAGHDVHVITYHLGDSRFPCGDLPVHRIPRVPGYRKICSGISPAKPLLDLLLLQTLAKITRNIGFDIIHAHNYEAPPAGYFVRRKFGIPVVYHAHNTMIHELPSYFRSRFLQTCARQIGSVLDRQIPGRADHIITVSQEQTDYLESIGVHRDRMTMIPPCVSSDLFSDGDGGHIRRQLGLDGHPLLIYTGGLQPYQNCGLLIDVLRHCLVDIPEIHLLILARSEPEWLLDRAVAAGVRDKVHVVQGQGLQFERDCLAAADVGIIPREHCIGYPVKMLNYAAAGLPIVCTSGLNKDFVAERNILVSRTGRASDLAANVIRLIRDDELRRRITESARKQLMISHSWREAVRTMESIYDNVSCCRRTFRRQ